MSKLKKPPDTDHVCFNGSGRIVESAEVHYSEKHKSDNKYIELFISLFLLGIFFMFVNTFILSFIWTTLGITCFVLSILILFKYLKKKF